METYFKVMFYVDYVIPLVLFGVLVLFCIAMYIPLLIKGIKQSLKSRWEAKFFIDHGYRRELIDVPSVGDGAFWGWMRGDCGKDGIADDRDLRYMTKQEIIEKYS